MVRLYASLALAATAAIAGASAKTSLYLSPAQNLAAPIGINAEEAHRILSHHIDVEGTGSDDSGIWDHLLHSSKSGNVGVDQRIMVERLFDGHQDEHNRLLVLMHGSAHDDVIPSSVSATHSIDSSPASNSFDALFDSYLSSVSQTLKSSESALSHLTGTFMDGFSASFDWFTAASDNAAAKWSQQAASLGSKLEEELRSAEALLSKLQSKDDKEEDLSMQPLRFSGLQEVESTYGVESEEFAKAKELVKEAVEEITSLFKSKSAEQGRQASIAFVVTDSSSNLVKRSTSDLLSPLLPRQTFSTLKKGSSPSPLPKNLLSTCFTSASSLEKATNNCSGHGKAVQSSKGGKPCYRCQCKPTEVRKGKKVYWAGAACEKKDVSTEFVLLASSVLLLVIVAGGSVYALASQGGQELPGTLASVSINLK